MKILKAAVAVICSCWSLLQRTSHCHFIDRLSDKKVSSRFAELACAVLPGQGVTVNIRQTFRQYVQYTLNIRQTFIQYAQYGRLLSLYHAQRFGDNLNFFFCFFSYLMKVFMYNVSLFQLKKNIMLFDKFRAMKIFLVSVSFNELYWKRSIKLTNSGNLKSKIQTG